MAEKALDTIANPPPFINNGLRAPISPFMELGTTGLRQFSGYVREEWLPQLQGLRAIKVYREMSSNDAMVGAILFAIEMLLRQVSWRVEPKDTTLEAAQAAEFLRGALFDDMSQSWPIILSEILSFLPYGFAYHELVYKRRMGMIPPAGQEQSPTWAPSRYNDGLIGWRKWPIRSQDTLLRWEFDEARSVRGFIQQDPLAGKIAEIPITKALLFRAFSWKGNPEGKSILRTAYRAWYRKTHIENIEGIGVYRDLAGIPYITAPQELFYETASAAEKSILDYIKKMGTGVAQDEQACIILPQSYDQGGHPLFEFKLLASAGSKQIDTSTIIQREDVHICQSVLADMLMVGHTNTGARAVAQPKADLFNLTLNGFSDAICEVINRHATPRLWTLNAFPPETMPLLTHGEVEHVDLNEFSQVILRYSQSGFDVTQDWPYIRQVSGFPPMSEQAEPAVGISGNTKG